MLRLLIPALLPLLVPSAVAQFDTFPAIRNTQAEGEHPPSPREMLDLFELPEGFKVTLFAGEPDVQQPIAFDFDDFGRIWVAENYTYSARAKIDQVMRDRVIILHDKDGDGEHDERKVFWDKGRMLTGLTWGYGGLWILNDGNLSFIPDKNGDDVPDSEPVPMLNGWTKNAGHNVVNGLMWGPDGWLYGRHGITDTSYPGTIDTPKEERQPMNCGIWRFHPVKHTFEIVCHGTTNPWGLDYNEVGDMFMSNNVIGHLWHVIPGAHYQRMFGQDFNPHCYELMGPISDHYHWDDTGKWSDSRDGKANDLGGGHSHCGLMLYYGQNFPKEYWGKAFMCNTHGRCVNIERIERKGSSYVAKHEPNFLKVNTPWFRGVQLAYGPAGCVYLSDWSDNGECHDHDGVHRTSGRIYRISYGSSTVFPTQLSKYPDTGLNMDPTTKEVDPYSAYAVGVRSPQIPPFLVRKSSRLLYEAVARFRQEAPKQDAHLLEYWGTLFFGKFRPNDPYERHRHPFTIREASELSAIKAIRLLEWADGLTVDFCRRMLFSRHETVRSTAVRAVFRNPDLFDELRLELYGLLRINESPVVGLAFASGLQHLEPVKLMAHEDRELSRRHREESLHAFEILTLLTNDTVTADSLAADPTLRLMTWYGALHHPGWKGRGNKSIAPFAIRRQFSEMDLSEAPNKSFVIELQSLSRRSLLEPDEVSGTLTHVLSALKGQRIHGFREWPDIRVRFLEARNSKLDGLVAELGSRMGAQRDLDELHKIVRNNSDDHPLRSRLVRTLGDLADDRSIPVFLSLLNDRAVYVDICKALAAFDDDPRIPTELLKRWSGLRHGAKEAATDTLCSRRSYAVEFTKAIADGRVDASILTAAQVRQLNAFNDSSITAIVDKHWGVINETPEALEASIAKWKQELTDDVLAKADLTKGAALFKKSCAACHKLYGEGGKIGPDLTGGNRANMDYLLSNIINPSGEVPKQYTVSVIALKSGRLVNGVVVSETEQTLTVQTDKEQIVVAKADIEEQTRTSKSLMPDGLLDNLKPDEVRDLIAFVRKRR